MTARVLSSQWRRPPKFAREIERRKHIGARQEGKRPRTRVDETYSQSRDANISEASECPPLHGMTVTQMERRRSAVSSVSAPRATARLTLGGVRAQRSVAVLCDCRMDVGECRARAREQCGARRGRRVPDAPCRRAPLVACPPGG